MSLIADYFVQHPLIALFLSLGLGYLLGGVKLRSFSLGATSATLLVALTIRLVVGQFTTIDLGSQAEDEVLLINLSSQVKDVFFGLFTFVLGYSVGPAFVRALRSSGVKLVALAVLYAVVAGLSVLAASRICRFDTDTTVGLMAGGFTQSAILGSNPADATSLTYSLTYVVGTLSSILFMQYLAPALLRVDLLKETKRKVDEKRSASADDEACIVQVRAFLIRETSACCGLTIGDIEEKAQHRFEVEAFHRDGTIIPPNHDTVIAAGDVLTVLGDVAALEAFDDVHIDEVSDAKYLRFRQATAELVLTTEIDEDIYATLTTHGLLIRQVMRGGRNLSFHHGMDLKKGDVLTLCGAENAVRQAVRRLGYLKDSGITSDITFLSLGMTAALIIGAVTFFLFGKEVALGNSLGALAAGLFCGWLYDRKPRVGYIAASTRWFIQSIGLNMFIAVVGLTSKLVLGDILQWRSLLLVAVAAVVTVLARTVILFMGKYLLKLDTVDLLGGLCGSGTNTAALNALAERTGSSAFTPSYAPSYAIGNVALILVGLLIENL